MTPSLKRKLTIGAVGAALLGVAGGGAYAATSSSSSSNPGRAFLNDVANRLHVSVADLQAAMKGAASDQIDQLVKDGKLTQAQADKVKQRIQQSQGPLLGAGKLFLGPLGGMGLLGGMDRGGALPVKPFFGGLDAAAKYFGLTDAQLRQRLGSGKSLADIAKAQNESVDGLKTAIKNQLKSQLDAAVTAKKITQAQESKILSNLDSRLDNVVNGKALTAPRKFFRPGARLRHGHFFAFPLPPGKPGG